MAGELRELRNHVKDMKGCTIETNIPREGFVQVNGPGAVGFSSKPKI